MDVHADGAYSSSRDQGGWAFVIVENDKMIFRQFGGVSKTTNNRMEIECSIRAIKYCIDNNIQEINLYVDSMYVLGTATLNYKRNANKDLWPYLDFVCSKIKINWIHEDGHSNNKWNDYCDLLAVHGSHLIL